jgi:hypothetical protein
MISCSDIALQIIGSFFITLLKKIFIPTSGLKLQFEPFCLVVQIITSLLEFKSSTSTDLYDGLQGIKVS